MTQTATAPSQGRKGSSGGFWSNLTSGLGEGIGSIGREVLPVWAAKELQLQKIDQLQESTFEPTQAPPRIDDQMRSTGDSAVQATDREDGISTNTILIVGASVVVGVMFLIAFKK